MSVIQEETLRSKEAYPAPASGLSDATESQEQATDDLEEGWYICRQCGQRVTQHHARVSTHGQHRHVFSNPSGIVFEIACFSEAIGYAFSGGYSTDFTWFTQYAWRIVICSHCLNHLGWFFSGMDGNLFFGFITDRVIAESPSPPSF